MNVLKWFIKALVTLVGALLMLVVLGPPIFIVLGYVQFFNWVWDEEVRPLFPIIVQSLFFLWWFVPASLFIF